jgi:hypothetical protein
MRNTLVTYLATLALVWSAGVMAHSNEELVARVGAHGGQIQTTGMYHVELLVADQQVQVWVSDHAEQPQATDGATATVMVVYPGETVTVPLAAAGKNRLVGRDARLKWVQNARVSVVLTMKDGSSGQTRFVLRSAGAAPNASAAGHAH